MNDLLLAMQRLASNPGGEEPVLELKDAAFEVTLLFHKQETGEESDRSKLASAMARFDAAVASMDALSPDIKKLLPNEPVRAAITIVESIVLSHRSH